MLVCALLSVTSLAIAQDAREVAIWYRSANGCPDGEAFMRSLAARSVRARLAQVGDAIDFVVTLGSDTAGSRGVVERQTETGTVAIRQVEDASCSQVADALSLTLALAANEAAEPAQTTAVPPAAVESEPALSPSPIIRVAEPVRPRTAPAEAPSTVRWSLGATGLFASGVAPGVLGGASALLELEVGAGVLRPAFRVAAFAAYGSGARGGEDISVRLLGGRFEVCPVELRSEPLALRPCLTLELAELHSERDGATGRSDSGLWAASEGPARVSWAVSPAFDFELQLGLLVPWTRYVFESDEDPPDVLHRVRGVGGSARIGAVVHFP